MFLLNGTPVQIDAPFTVGDINYPPGWLRFATPDARAALGFVEVPDPVRPDDRFFWVDEHNVATPKDIAQLKEQWVDQVKATAHSLLTDTDWLVIREVEEPGSMPDYVKAFRRRVREVSGQIEHNIGIAIDVPSLEALINAGFPWPELEKPAQKKTSNRGHKG